MRSLLSALAWTVFLHLTFAVDAASAQQPGRVYKIGLLWVGEPGAAGYQFDTRAPQIRETLTGIKRTHGTHQAANAPAVVADFKAMIEAQRGTLAGLRDCALLLLGFAGALRRSELSSLDVEAHWTVVRGAAKRRIRVLDSGGWMFMTIRSKAHRGARRNNFQPSKVFLLRLTPQVGTQAERT